MNKEKQENQNETPKKKRMSYILGRVERKESQRSKSELINGYRRVIEKWECPILMSIEIGSVPAQELDEGIKFLFEAFRKINKSIQRVKTGHGKRFVCVKSFECNFNSIRNTFNLCFHIIIPEGDFFYMDWEWIKIKLRNYIPISQTWYKITDIENVLEHLIESSGKICIDPTIDAKGILPFIYVKMPQCIHLGNKRYKPFEHFGFSLPKKVNMNDDSPNVEIVFSEDLNSWVFEANYQGCTVFNSTGVLKDILKNSR